MIDSFVSLSSALCALLARERFQKLLVAKDEVKLLIALAYDSYTLYLEDVPIAPLTRLPHLESKQEEEILSLRDKVTERFWDISQLDEFRIRYLVDSDLINTMCGWLSVTEPHLQICACNILRGITHSEQASVELLNFLLTPQTALPRGTVFDPRIMEEICKIQNSNIRLKIHHLLGLLRIRTNPQVTEEGLRLLNNLARPQTNKTTLINSLPTIEVVMSVCSCSAIPQVRAAALTSIRQLLDGSVNSVKYFILGASPGRSVRPHWFLDLLSLYESNDVLTIRMEIALIIVMIWRVAYAKNDDDLDGNFGTYLTDGPIDQAWSSNRNIAAVMFALIFDSANRSLVTQGWFGLVLMTKSSLGSDMVYDFIYANAMVFQMNIRALVAGSPDQINAMVLYENLIVRYV